MKKRFALYIFCLVLSITMLTGCFYAATQPTQPTQQEELPRADMTDAERLDFAAKWLDKDFSFTLDYLYKNYEINGIKQHTEQIYAKDGSWSMVTTYEIWNDSRGLREKTLDQYYYRFEDSQLVCYSKNDGNDAPVRIEISQGQKAEMDRSKELLVGKPGLMPDYLEGLYLTHPTGNDAVTVLAYWLPVDRVMEDETVLSTYVNYAFDLSGNAYPSDAKAGILVLLEADTQTLRPISLTCFFHELQPYVLTADTQGEGAAAATELMSMTYVFDFDLPDTVTVPAEMIP